VRFHIKFDENLFYILSAAASMPCIQKEQMKQSRASTNNGQQQQQQQQSVL